MSQNTRSAGSGRKFPPQMDSANCLAKKLSFAQHFSGIVNPIKFQVAIAKKTPSVNFIAKHKGAAVPATTTEMQRVTNAIFNCRFCAD